MANYHFIGGDGKTYGPYPLEKLREFREQNRLDGESKVQKDGGEFQPASAYPELAESPPPQVQPYAQPPQPSLRHATKNWAAPSLSFTSPAWGIIRTA